MHTRKSSISSAGRRTSSAPAVAHRPEWPPPSAVAAAGAAQRLQVDGGTGGGPAGAPGDAAAGPGRDRPDPGLEVSGIPFRGCKVRCQSVPDSFLMCCMICIIHHSPSGNGRKIDAIQFFCLPPHFFYAPGLPNVTHKTMDLWNMVNIATSIFSRKIGKAPVAICVFF